MKPRRLLILPLAALVCALGAPPASAKPKKNPVKKEYDYRHSKYKSYKALTDDNNTYRFDANGNPVAPEKARKKSGAQKPVPSTTLSGGRIGQQAPQAPAADAAAAAPLQAPAAPQ